MERSDGFILNILRDGFMDIHFANINVDERSLKSICFKEVMLNEAAVYTQLKDVPRNLS